MVDKATRAMTRMCTQDDQQWKNVVEWCKRNPLKEANIYALDAEERDRIKSRLEHFNGDRPLLNAVVTVKPDNHTSPVFIKGD